MQVDTKDNAPQVSQKCHSLCFQLAVKGKKPFDAIDAAEFQHVKEQSSVIQRQFSPS